MRIVIFGATSVIAREIALRYAERGAELTLVGRDGSRLQEIADDLSNRGGRSIETLVQDLADVTSHRALVEQVAPNGDIVLIAHGSLPDQLMIDHDPDAQLRHIQLNAVSVISLVARCADIFERRRHGALVVIGSVAGDRGRRSNYVYGAAKAAVHAYCEGLRGRLRQAGVRMILIKPGWVDTPMARDVKARRLVASAESVSHAIQRAIDGGRSTVYVPWFWRWISLAVRLLPERLVKF